LAEDVINSLTVYTVLTQLLQEVQSILAKLLAVQPVTNITYQQDSKCVNGVGGPVPIPNEFITNGQTSDLLILITARPSASVATTANCYKDRNSNRPISAHINLDPNFFFKMSSYTDQIGTLLHEITHALGFSSEFYDGFISADTVFKTMKSFTDASGVATSKTINYLKTPKLVSALQTHFGCNVTVPGAELEEGGSPGTAGSHFEKRIFYGELMTGSKATGVSFSVSSLTLSFLEDTGWYQANYTYIVPGSTPLLWGKNTGCNLIFNRCEDWNVGGSLSESYFCTDRTQTRCTFNLLSKGFCQLRTYDTNLGYYEHIPTNPKIGGIDSLMDYCPYMNPVSFSGCRGSGSGEPFEVYGGNSACWDSNLVISRVLKSVDARCLEYACDANTTLRVRVGNTWLDCPQNQSFLNITSGFEPGYSGYITCPTNGYNILCDRTLRVPLAPTTPFTTTQLPSSQDTTRTPRTPSTAASTKYTYTMVLVVLVMHALVNQNLF
jgi:leishmanolysin